VNGHRLGPVSGLLLCLLWAPMALVIPRLPDLGSAADVERFWRDNSGLMQVVLLSVSVGFLFFLTFLGALVGRLRASESSEALTWTAFGSSLMFMTALNVSIGLDAAARLLLEDGPPGSTYALHTAGFVLAAPAAFAGVGFFVAVAALTFTAAVLPRWLGWLAGVGAVANVGAVGGVLSLTGPLNSGNGALGGIAAPLGMYMVWIFCASLWWLRTDFATGHRGRVRVATQRISRNSP
jgi:hypothetical protein